MELGGFGYSVVGLGNGVCCTGLPYEHFVAGNFYERINDPFKVKQGPRKMLFKIARPLSQTLLNNVAPQKSTYCSDPHL